MFFTWIFQQILGCDVGMASVFCFFFLSDLDNTK